jgi:hypothetical protein
MHAVFGLFLQSAFCALSDVPEEMVPIYEKQIDGREMVKGHGKRFVAAPGAIARAEMAAKRMIEDFQKHKIPLDSDEAGIVAGIVAFRMRSTVDADDIDRAVRLGIEMLPALAEARDRLTKTLGIQEPFASGERVA